MNPRLFVLPVAALMIGFIVWVNMQSSAVAPPGVTPWPPVVGQPYPDLALPDHTGVVRTLSDYKGRIIIIKPIGMNCPACNAFAGAHRKGGYGGAVPQRGLRSLESYFPQYLKGIDPRDPRLLFVDLLLYDYDMGTVTVEDAAAWAKHFGIDQKPNHLVLAGGAAMQNKASYRMIPGAQLIDPHFILRADAAGHRPQHDLFRQLLPMVPRLLGE